MANLKDPGDASIQKDLENFLDFKEKWNTGTLTEDHVVYRRVRYWAARVAHGYNNADDAQDLEQSCLMALATANYKGLARLDTFIVQTLLRKNIASWKARGGKQRAEFPDEVADAASRDLMESTLLRTSAEQILAEALKTKHELKRFIVLTIIQAEPPIGRRRLAQLATEKLYREVTPYEVEVALKQLRESLQKFYKPRNKKNRRG